MELSIVVPTLNEAASLATCLQSARQMGTDRLSLAQIIVADGGSTDATCEIAREAGARVVETTASRGAQLRAGVEATTGEVVLMLHADSRLPADAGEQLATALLDKNAQAGFFRQRIDAAGWRYRLVERGNAFRGRVLRLPYGDQAIFLRRDLLDQVGGVPSLPLMEDVALMRRVAKLTGPVELPGPLLVSPRRWQRHGLVRQTLRNWSLVLGYLAGVPVERLTQWYAPHVSPTTAKEADSSTVRATSQPAPSAGQRRSTRSPR